MFKEIISSKEYWKSVLVTGLMFIIIFSLIMVIFQYSFNLEEFSQQNLKDGKWMRYLISRIIGGLIYGCFMGYVVHRNKAIKDKSKRG